MLSADDANDLSVPLGLFISKDEPIEEVGKYLSSQTCALNKLL